MQRLRIIQETGDELHVLKSTPLHRQEVGNLTTSLNNQILTGIAKFVNKIYNPQKRGSNLKREHRIIK